MADIFVLLKKPSFIMKFVELAFAILAVVLFQESYYYIALGNRHKTAIVFTVLCGYVLIIAMQIVTSIVEELTSKYLAMLWAILGALLWLAASGIILETYAVKISGTGVAPFKDKFLSSGVIALLNSLVFLVDFAATFKYD